MYSSPKSDWQGMSWRPKSLLLNTDTARLLQVASDLHYEALRVDAESLKGAALFLRAQQRLQRVYQRLRKERLRDQALFLFYFGEVVGLTRLLLEAQEAHALGYQVSAPSVSSSP
jgi:hypothetical protein